MDFIDFHTHLDWYQSQENLFTQLSSFHGTIISASVDEKSYKKNVEISQKAKALGYCNIIPTFGIHPEKVPEAPEDLSIFNKLCKSSPIIGEIGMDFCWYKEASPEKQEKAFRYFLNHCNENGKYCVIHTKDAEKQIAEILKEYPNAKPIIHWYDGPEDIYKDFIQRNYLFTFGCETARSKHIQKLLKLTPNHQILAETDNPTAEPWLGGTDNSVNLIKRVYNDIAKVKNLTFEETVRIINENSTKLL